MATKEVSPGQVTGIRKAAVLTLVLGEDAASQLFKFLSEEEIEALAHYIAHL